MKRLDFSNTLPHIIEDIPNPANLPQYNYKTDDKKIIMHTESPKKKRIRANILLFLIIAVIGLIITVIDKQPVKTWIRTYLIIFVLIPFIFFSSYSFLIYRQKESIMILNREKGTVTIPCGIMRKAVEKPFREAIGFTSSASGYGSYYIGIRFKGHGKGDILSSWKNLPGEWAFYVWYMDRNRPLPPGNVFAEYRKRDSARLRAEGYPTPLYPMTPAVEQRVKDFYKKAVNADISPKKVPDEIV
jgi:hypothetical protein